MLLVAATILALQQQQDYQGPADRLAEKLQWITTTVKELREKKRVHLEALAEVEAYLATIRRSGSDLQAKARQLEEMQRSWLAKSKEFDAAESEWEREDKLYDQQLKRYDERKKELNQRWTSLNAEIDAHNARQSSVPAGDESYSQNAKRLNGIKDQLKSESSRFDTVDLPAIQAFYDKVERLRLTYRAASSAKIDIANDLIWDSSDFRSDISSMERPAEALHSLLMEYTGKKAAVVSYRTQPSKREATAQTLAEAFGGGLDLPDSLFAEVYILRPSRDRGTTREYIVERLRLGELIETIRALVPESSDKTVGAEKAFDGLSPAAAGKPSALVKGAAWSMKPPDASVVKPQRAPDLKGS